MRKRFDWKWESLDETTFRSKVIGGWVLRSRTTNKNHASESIVFIADRDHEWAIMPPTSELPAKNKTNPDDFKSTI